MRRGRRNRRPGSRLKGFAAALAILPILIYVFSTDRLSFPPWSIPSKARPHGGIVAKVIDGDTIELAGGARVRYIGVNTPELRRRVDGRWIYRPQRLAEEAKAFNTGLVMGKRIRLEYDQERKDRYDRWLAYAFVGEVFVNAELVKAGFARVTLYPPNLRYADLFLRLEERARDQGLGVWAENRRRRQGDQAPAIAMR